MSARCSPILAPMALTIGTNPHRDSSDLLQAVGRYEFKYLISRRKADDMRNCVRQLCGSDPRANVRLPNYETFDPVPVKSHRHR